MSGRCRCTFNAGKDQPERPPATTRRFPKESGWLTRDGKVFRTDDGRVWSYRGASAFLLFYRFLIGEDIDPVLDQWEALGPNTLRVLSMVGWDNLAPRFFPQQFAGVYVPRLHAFIQKVADRGFRIEWTLLADAQIVMPDPAQQQKFVNDLTDIFDLYWNCSFRETCNEPFKNGVDVQRVVPRSGLSHRANGMGVTEMPDIYAGAPGPPVVLPHLEYVTVHTERKDDWPRTPKDAQDWRDGFNGGTDNNGRAYRGFEALNCPVICDEPMGADEVDDPGRRSNVPADFRHYAACAALTSGGSTYHGTDALNAVLLRPTQYECAYDFFTGASFCPPEAQIAPYERGDADGWPAVGNMPMQHFDSVREHVHDGALRTFCKEVDGVQYCVAIRPGPDWKAEGMGGYHVVAEPARGLVVLTR